MTTGTELATAGATLPADIASELQAAAGQGAENVGAEDVALPFIKVVQALSAEMKPTKPQFIKGCNQGDFANTVTREVYRADKGLWFVPVYFKRAYLEWGPEVGDGFKGEHGPDILSKTKKDGAKNILPDGNQIQVTGVWYVLVVDPATGASEPAVISLASTQLKHSRGLMTRLGKVAVSDGKGGSFTPPLRYNVVRASSQMTSNQKGDWFAWQFATSADKDPDGNAGLPNGDTVVKSVFDLPNGLAIFARASELYKLAASGQVKTAAPDGEGVAADEGGDGEEAPF